MTPIGHADLAALMGGATPHAVLDVRERARTSAATSTGAPHCRAGCWKPGCPG